MTREEWLLAAIEKLRPVFDREGSPLPEKIRVSVGFPGGGNRKQRIGECWINGVSDDVPTIFISPTLDDTTRILGVLTHELCHTVAPGHGRPFAKIASAVGLTAPWAATGESEGLKVRLHALASELGPLDHGPITLGQRKKQSTRMLKLTCPQDGYLVRTTQRWVEVGMPYCPVGHVMELAA